MEVVATAGAEHEVVATAGAECEVVATTELVESDGEGLANAMIPDLEASSSTGAVMPRVKLRRKRVKKRPAAAKIKKRPAARPATVQPTVGIPT